jgi:hypothetical protein
MRRWFFILMGAVGVCLTAGAVVGMVYVQPLSQLNATRALIVEIIGLILGVVLGIAGFVNGRNAGELDISTYMKARRRDHHVSGSEISFACPACGKRYRGSPLLAGKPFTCRDCQQVFSATPSDASSTEPPGPMQRRLLPHPKIAS